MPKIRFKYWKSFTLGFIRMNINWHSKIGGGVQFFNAPGLCWVKISIQFWVLLELYSAYVLTST